jgi:hypothetical protein
MFYRMWTTALANSDPGMDYYEQKYQELILKNLQKKADAFGFQLVPKPEEKPSSPSSPTLALAALRQVFLESLLIFVF